VNKLDFAIQMQARTKAFAVQVIRFFGKLPKTDESRIVGRQLLRSATSVAANYRATCRSKSEADFIHKLGTVVEEADETLLWIQLLEESSICPSSLLAPLKGEAEELVRILQTSLNRAKRNAGR
jgi:four helix bundle protein